MTRDCSSLKDGEQVVFYIYSDIYEKKIPETGTVSGVNLHRKEVYVHWLEGYKDRHDVISYSDMIAVYNKDGEMMQWPGISGPSDLLTYDLENEQKIEQKEIETELE